MISSPTDSHSDLPKHLLPIRVWVIFLGLALIIPNAFWVVEMHNVKEGPYTTLLSLFANCIFILTGLLLLNIPLRRYLPKIALNRAELITIYSMLCIGSALASLDMIPILVEMMAAPFRDTQRTQDWLSAFGQFLPHELTVANSPALKGFFIGNDTLYKPFYLHIWIPPILRWCSFIFAFLFMMLCASSLLARQWIDRERLSFPIVMLPIRMTEEGTQFWKNKLLWGGIVIAGGIDLLNGLNYLYPSLPTIGVKQQDLLPLISMKPWNAIGWTPVSFYPLVIGLGYLLPVDLLFSCWFFYIFWKLELVLCNAMAWDATPDFPFIPEQAFGGYMAIVVLLIWTGRSYFRSIFQKVFLNRGDLPDSAGAMAYRSAMVGLILAISYMAGFLWRYGLSPIWAIAAVIIYLAMSVAITRMRSELGPPVHDLFPTGPESILTRGFGTHAFNGQSLAVINFFWWFNRANRSNPMPFMLETQKMNSIVNTSQRRSLQAIMLAGVVGTFAAFWAFLHLGYQLGTAAKFFAGTGHATEGYDRLARWISNPTRPNIQANWAMLFGFVFSAFLMLMRLRYFWWPFHPLGFALASSWSMNLVWMPLAIAWLIKILVLRWGKLRLYKQYEPFFLGLILGQFLIGCIWSLIGLYFNIPTYSFWGA